jgi:2-polyprenyl-3-methyl-5-hydroxy-6-metoxy-1,4-benzoquinol methylase
VPLDSGYSPGPKQPDRRYHPRSNGGDHVSISELREQIASTLWYHTIEIAPGLVTPGWFDLRPVLKKLPWPDVRGKRCLDVGTYDGFLAYEMERRGASEVIAVDIEDHTKWDWPVDVRATGGEELAKLAGPEKSRGFRIASKALGSKVALHQVNVYDLSPDLMGTFDVVVCGSLMLHLRDPLRALEAIRSVCTGMFLSAEEIDLGLTVRHPKKPLFRLNGLGELCQWFTPNLAGHRRMVMAGGFQIERATRPYVIPFGASHPPRARTPHSLLREALQRSVTGAAGVPHGAILARPC